MEPAGLISSIYDAAFAINSGRKGFANRGKERKGRILYEKGIAEALTAFKKAQISADPQIIIFAEYTFISQELHFCDDTDKDSLNSLTKAVESFDDAFLALKIVKKHFLYQAAEKTYPHSSGYRVKCFPRDAFHIACKAHKTRLKNILKTPGIDSIEKSLLKQRIENLAAAQNGYVKKQKNALTGALHM